MSILTSVIDERNLGPELFPFAFITDHSFQLVEIGPSFQKIVPDVKLGMHLDELLELIRPRHKGALSLELFKKSERVVTLFSVRATGCRYRCQTVVTDDYISFYGAPAIEDDAQLTKLGLQFTDFPIADPTVDMVFYYCAQRHATKNAEELAERLDLSRQRFESIFDNAADAIFIHDIDQRLHNVNESAVKMHGFSKDEFVSMYVHEFDSLNQPASILEKLIELSTNPAQVDVRTTRHRRKDGTEFPVEVRTRIFQTDDKEPLFICMVTDTTQRVAIENNLRVARDEAISASKAKSEFVASMSHELRTPLNGILGMVQLLEKTELSPKQLNYLNACRASGQTLLTVIGDILDFSKIEAGKLELDQHPMEILSIIESVVQLMSLRKQNSNVELACFVDPALDVEVLGDGNRFRQVLFNVVGNATKFTHKGQISVIARLLEQGKDALRCSIEVTDTGIGIPNKKMADLFQPFSQVDSSTTRKYGGSGLGLTITKELVELMGGSIQVTSELGFGSTFRIEVQFDRCLGKPVRSNSLAVKQVAKLKIAVLGIKFGVAKLLKELFEAWSVDCVFHFLNRRDDELSDLASFDAVLIDCDHDHNKLMAIVSSLRARQTELELPIIPMCSPGSELTSLQMKSFGLAPAVMKPVSQSQLLDALVAAKHEEELIGADSLLSSSPLAKVPEDRGCVRVLLVEDNKVNQMFAEEIFSTIGYQYKTCENGKEAIETLLENSDYDVILMDCHMPVMDGFEASRKIRMLIEGSKLPPIPVVALTANALAGDREKCFEAGMSHYLAKPYSCESLVEIVDKCVEQKRSLVS